MNRTTRAPRRAPGRRQGFTLVELAVVLTIVGLIVGGVLVGADLIKSATLRNLYRDVERYKSAVLVFREKYHAIPGDMANATQIFGTRPDGCYAGVSMDGTCNGDGNKTVQDIENHLFWQHLSLAGLVGDRFTGRPGPGVSVQHVPGVNCPRTYGNDIGIGVRGYGMLKAGDTVHMFPGDYRAAFTVGRAGGWEAVEGFLQPSEAYLVDKKVDDGRPGLGNWVTRTNDITGQANCSTGDTYHADTAEYRLDMEADMACGFHVRKVW